MITTVIVDDDVEALKGLRNFIPWEESGFTVVGTASDGRGALSLVRKTRPGLLIADITMPAMDGLTLIRESLRVCPRLKSIVLTCHEDFAYAQEAISLGVMDYLIKIALTPEMLTRSLRRVRQAVGREHGSDDAARILRNELRGSPLVVQSEFLAELAEADRDEADQLMDRAARAGIGFPGTAYRVLCFFLDDRIPDAVGGIERRAPASSVLATIRDACGNAKDTSLFALGDASFVLLLWYRHEPLGLPADLMAGVSLALRRVLTLHGLAASCCVSGPRRDLRDLAGCVDDCRSMRESYFYGGPGRVVMERPRWASTQAPLGYEELSQSLVAVLRTPDEPAVAEFMERLAGLGRAPQCAPPTIRGVLARLLVDVDTAANKRGFVLEHSLGSADTFPGCMALFRSVLAAYRDRAHDALPRSSREEITSVLRFIHAHRGAAGVKCEEMAARVGLSPSYFSRLFKKEVGLSYTDYLLKRRIEHARELLAETRMSFEEITWAVGLENASYFHRAFKKATGLTPRQAR